MALATISTVEPVLGTWELTLSYLFIVFKTSIKSLRNYLCCSVNSNNPNFVSLSAYGIC